jgi:hypothetical protein
VSLDDLHGDTVCPFSYETCLKWAKICRESFLRVGNAELNDCPVAVRWNECFRERILVPYSRKRKAAQKLMKKEGSK